MTDNWTGPAAEDFVERWENQQTGFRIECMCSVFPIHGFRVNVEWPHHRS